MVSSTSMATALGGHTLVADANIAELKERILPLGTIVNDNTNQASTPVTGVIIDMTKLSLTAGDSPEPLVAEAVRLTILIRSRFMRLVIALALIQRITFSEVTPTCVDVNALKYK